MFARVSTYGIVLAALLMTACSQNETELKSVPEKEPVPISFSFTSTQDNQAMTRGDTEDAQLRNTGFGVFATVEGTNYPNLMYNQQVTYIYLADDNYLTDKDGNLTSQAQNGYWSYSPTKYWPMKTVEVDGELKDVPQAVTFCAYAPYVAAGGATGITAVSDNTDKPYLDYTLSEEFEKTVDLLWTCCVPSVLGPIKFDMYHALTRVAVNVKLNDTNTYKTSTTKVLISEITLSTTGAAKTGRLKLDDDNTETETIDEVVYTYHYPTWKNQTTGSRTVKIQNTDNSDSYGIIAEDIRYINDLPYSWQPEGLQKDGEGKGVLANALCTANHPVAYVYFIPNNDGLTLSCTVYYTLMDNGGGIHNAHSTKDVAITPLRGNRTYQLNLIIDPATP